MNVVKYDHVNTALCQKTKNEMKRGISQVRRDTIETPIAKTIVYSAVPKGTIFHIDYVNQNFVFDIQKPIKKSKEVKTIKG